MSVERKRLGLGLNLAKHYHTQRNNMIDPHGSCNVTAYTMAARRCGRLWSYGDNEQPEDVFARFLCSEESVKKLKRLAPWAASKQRGVRYKVYEVHAMLAWGYNQLVIDGRAEFRTTWSLSELVYLLLCGAGVVVSGDFPHYRLGRIGHVVSVGDVVYDGDVPDGPSGVDLGKLKSLVIDDPYGDYRVGYNPHVEWYDKGNDVRVSRADVFNVLKNKSEDNGYWAHVLLRTGV